jgi:hypothetical protein
MSHSTLSNSLRGSPLPRVAIRGKFPKDGDKGDGSWGGTEFEEGWKSRRATEQGGEGGGLEVVN